jgi:hypothetical protein
MKDKPNVLTAKELRAIMALGEDDRRSGIQRSSCLFSSARAPLRIPTSE